MATGYGLNRNMGRNKMTDKQYEQYARATPYCRQYKDMSPNDHYIVKRKTWLLCFGLLETWDVIK